MSVSRSFTSASPASLTPVVADLSISNLDAFVLLKLGNVLLSRTSTSASLKNAAPLAEAPYHAVNYTVHPGLQGKAVPVLAYRNILFLKRLEPWMIRPYSSMTERAPLLPFAISLLIRKRVERRGPL